MKYEAAGASQKEKERRILGNRGVLDRAAVWLADRMRLYDRQEKRRKLHEDIQLLSGGRRGALREFYIRKTRTVLKASCAAAVCAAGAVILALAGSPVLPEGRLKRPKYGETARAYSLQAQMEDKGRKEIVDLDLAVESRQYTKEQETQLLNQAEEELEHIYLNGNPSADEVRYGLLLPKSLQNGAVSVSWLISSYDLLDDTGRILREPDENGETVTLQAEISCQDSSILWEQGVRILPPVYSASEEENRKVRLAADEAQSRDRSEEYLYLPSEIDGSKVEWRQKESTGGSVLLLIALLLPVMMYVHCDQQVHEEAARREQQLRMDYPELMWKMTMLLGAGLTLSGTFAKIAEDYRRKPQGKEKRYVYEEMLYTCREISSGNSESIAYERFGRRCGQPRYIQLGTILSQNLRKGSKGLASLLEKEAISTMNERRDEARKLGEKAGTKLLLPMVLMLCVVMVILTVPAFLAM